MLNSTTDQKDYQLDFGCTQPIVSCGMCDAYYPYTEYADNIDLSQYKDYGLCSECGGEFHYMQSRPNTCPRNGSCRIVCLTYH